MSNPYYTATGTPTTGAIGASASIRAEFAAISAAFDKLVTFTGNPNKLVVVNAGGTGTTSATYTVSGITQLLDPAYVTDYTGAVAGVKRLNSATGLFESFDGTSWSTQVLSYLRLNGGALTGAVTSSSTWNGQTISSAASLTGTLTVAGVLTASGGVTGNLTGNASGNAGTATKLQTARLINGVSFDGSADINVVNITGNAGTATKLQTARLINGVSFDGSADITVSVTNITGNAATATLATKASTLAAGGANGTAMTFSYAGQSGQPAWLWGTNDGVTIQVYSPSNFNVNSATTAGSASSASTATTASNVINNSARTDAAAYPVLWSPAGGGGGQPTYSCSAVTINSSTGQLAASSLYASGDITAFSDMRVKAQVETIANGLSKVRAMRGVTYTRTDQAHMGERQAGVIAQEVQGVMPEFVKTAEDGMLSVAYGNMVSVLIEAVKELADQVDALRVVQ